MFSSIVFAGGGSRCFWQAGFWDGARKHGIDFDNDIKFAASVSAGCAIATSCLLDRNAESLELFCELTARNPKNIYWANLKPGSQAPFLPHIAMYREALNSILSEDDLSNLGDKELQYLIAEPPRALRSGWGTAVAFLTYGLEKRIKANIHPTWTQRLGYRAHIGSSTEAQNLEELIGMIMASSCVPPVLSAGRWRGRYVLDGGLIDNVPVHLTDERPGDTLVLLSKRYNKPLPVVQGRTYVQPSRQITMDKFDYANPQGLRDTYELGLADGAAFAALQRKR